MSIGKDVQSGPRGQSGLFPSIFFKREEKIRKFVIHDQYTQERIQRQGGVMGLDPHKARLESR